MAFIGGPRMRDRGHTILAKTPKLAEASPPEVKPKPAGRTAKVIWAANAAPRASACLLALRPPEAIATGKITV